MSKSMKTVIEASFDINQLGTRFTGKYKRSSGDDQPVEGPFAGTLYFQRGEEIHVHLRAGAAVKADGKQPFKSFEVVDCTMTTRPRVYRLDHEKRHVEFPPASPFTSPEGVVRGASTNLPAAQFVPGEVAQTPGYYVIERKWNSFLTMGQFNARWLMTLMATVKIEHNDGKIEYRVMEIDPETEVGTGTNPPP